MNYSEGIFNNSFPAETLKSMFLTNGGTICPIVSFQFIYAATKTQMLKEDALMRTLVFDSDNNLSILNNVQANATYDLFLQATTQGNITAQKRMYLTITKNVVQKPYFEKGLDNVVVVRNLSNSETINDSDEYFFSPSVIQPNSNQTSIVMEFSNF